MGPKGSRFVIRGERPTGKIFLPVRKSPFTNTAISLLFCSPKVNISLFLMESLHYGEILDESCINNGFNRAIVTGNISLFWG